jgi:ankyrin repeat protein
MDNLNLNIQDYSGKSTPIIRAMITGKVNIVKLLISARAKLNLKDFEGNTVLHHAIITENVELVVKLIQAGALENIQNTNGQTPLDLASRFMRSSLEEELDN